MSSVHSGRGIGRCLQGWMIIQGFMRRWRGGGIDVLSFELWGSKGMDLGVIVR